MWAGEFFLMLRTAYLERVEDERRDHRIAAFVNYHILMSQGAKVGTFTDFLRGYKLLDEERLAPEEVAQRKDKIVEQTLAIWEQVLARSGQKRLVRDKAGQNGNRRIPNPRRGRTGRRPGSPYSGDVPENGNSVGGDHAQRLRRTRPRNR